MDQIIHGDCVEVLNSLERGKIDLIFADPPFNIGLKGYDGYSDKLDPDQYYGWTDQWLSGCDRVLKKGGSIYVAIGDEFAAEVCTLMKRRWTMRNWIIWNYGFGENQKKKFNRCKTHVLYFVKGKEYVWNGDEIKVPSARQAKYGDKRAKAGGKMPDDVWDIFAATKIDLRPLINCEYLPQGLQVNCKGNTYGGKITGLYLCDKDHRGYYPIPAGLIRGTEDWPEWKMSALRTILGSGVDIESAVEQVEEADPTTSGSWLARETAAEALEENPSDIWKISRLCGTFKQRIKDKDGSAHPCQMPLEVLDRIIKVSSNSGDTVLDPFCGTGTTAASANALGRNFITIDQSEKYCKVAANRLFKDENKFERFVVAEDQMSLF
jgi:DNA modification methylase